MTLMRAANIVRPVVLDMCYNFNGYLNDEQYNVRPNELLSLILMIMGGTNIEQQTNNYEVLRPAAEAVTDTIVFNTSIYFTWLN